MTFTHSLLAMLQASVPAPAVPPDPAVLAPYAFTGMTIVFVQKYLKENQGVLGHLYAAIVRGLPGADKYAHIAIAALLSLAGTLGIHYSWNWSWDHGGHFSGDIPAGQELLLALWTATKTWGKTMLTQQTIYSATNQPAYVPPAPGGKQ